MRATCPAEPSAHTVRPRSGARAPRTGARATSRPARLLVGLLGAVLALSGCGLRLETPPPEPLVPDAVEVVRSRAVDDALALAAGAADLTEARAAAAAPEDALTPVLADLVAFSTAHAEQLGGVYDSGLPEPTGTATAAPSPAPVADPAALLALVATAADTARTDADAVEDGQLARLLASVATARSGLRDRLGAAIGSTPPEPADPAPSPAASVQAGPLTPGTYADLVVAEDEVGYAYEVVAAKLSGDARAAAQADAAAHRGRAEAWAREAGVDGTAIDPRRTAYALPGGIDDPAVAVELGRTLELRLTVAYASAVAVAPAGARTAVIEALRTADAESAAHGAPPVAFPGLPERQPGADAAPDAGPAEPAGGADG
ncbi:DUF4439 domain-containing protein [Cellulomonas cellasea]|uniref:DUF4439 domain-containing protein n=1 Tax=Cellulomonas cellasea TaxID=43670 RepID=A0A4Y3KYP3_9CELL|nr:DUF4439 domain-containing protein [Cellulomonas cellasea]GEA88345.1 hypothetical protein CCE01nite_22940 [Cellulomonas cellasea]